MNGSKPKLLLVDDDPNMLVLIETLLSNDYDVHTAADGISGSLSAHDIQPDVILLDLGMPGVGGWDVLYALKENHLTNAVPVVLFTANNTPAYRSRAAERGCQGFVGKPLNEKELFSVLDAVLL